MANARQAQKPVGALTTGVEGLTIVESSRGLEEMVLPQQSRGDVTNLLGVNSAMLGKVTDFAQSIAVGTIGVMTIGNVLRRMIDLI